MVEQVDLEKYLTRQLSKQSKAERQIEKIRLEIVKKAQEAVDQYEKERQEAEPQAKEAIQQIIGPWWDEFRKSRVYSLLSGTGQRQVDLSQRFNHLWPVDVFKEIKQNLEGKRKPFGWQAGWDLEKFTKREKSEIKIPQGRSNRSFFRVCGTKFYLDGDLFINKWPEGAGGMYFSGYDQKVDFADFGQGLTSIHPVVFIVFAETIGNGQVWEIIEKSIKAGR